MEFSFDRPNTNGPRKTETSEAAAEQADTSSIANERLRKAIERNRAKQAMRETQAPPQRPFQARATAPVEPAVQEQPHPQHQQASFFEKPQSEYSEEPREIHQEVHQEIPREAPRAREMPRSTSVVSRRSVAKPDDTEFVPVKRATKKVASQISYTTTSSRKKSKPLDPKLTGYLVKGCWIFCGVMVLRLIFANGGITDYYSQKSQVNERINQLTDIKKENMQLVREIERMRSDSGFQKKLVRDNLGFIANDEYLILFPKEN